MKGKTRFYEFCQVSLGSKSFLLFLTSERIRRGTTRAMDLLSKEWNFKKHIYKLVEFRAKTI